MTCIIRYVYISVENVFCFNKYNLICVLYLNITLFRDINPHQRCLQAKKTGMSKTAIAKESRHKIFKRNKVNSEFLNLFN